MARWQVLIHDDFARELRALDKAVLKPLMERLQVIALSGPSLGRPLVGTLSGSRFANLKELRFNAAGGVWRVAFAFDYNRRAVILAGGNKAGQSERLFYRRLINIAEQRLESHLSDPA